MAARVLNDRFVNRSRKPGHNMETDIAMEHTIKPPKVLINGMGANKTQKAVQRVTCSVGGVQCICQSYDRNSDLSHLIQLHTPEKQLKLMNSAWSKTSKTASPSKLYLVDVMPLSATSRAVQHFL